MPMKFFKKEKPSTMAQVEECLAYIRKQTSFKPDIALILGTGLGDFASKIKAEKILKYEDLPFFPKTTALGHAGNMILGEFAGKKVAALEGRFHFFEGYSLAEVTFPVRVLNKMGAKILVVTNAAGGINLRYKKGEIVLITDHINFMGVNPLVGPNDDKLGPRFPDMCEPYSKRLYDLTIKAAMEAKVLVNHGVYIGVTGPCLETKAEYRMMKNMGADLVGMSTVPEVIVGIHMGMEILGISIVTDVCNPDHLEPVNIQEIIKIANEAGPKLDKLLGACIGKF